MLLDPLNPVYNTVVVYIIIISIILIIKPESMYCKKTDTFKPFGLNDNQTIMSFPVVIMGSGVLLYTLFLTVSVCCKPPN